MTVRGQSSQVINIVVVFAAFSCYICLFVFLATIGFFIHLSKFFFISKTHCFGYVLLSLVRIYSEIWLFYFSLHLPKSLCGRCAALNGT